MAAISASVGRGGKNNRQDVITVQQLLKKANVNPGLVDGICGPKTINAIAHIRFRVKLVSSLP
jgi:peptidoglycan hydrolase-like protein with peptidoglycan-binding domain